MNEIRAVRMTERAASVLDVAGLGEAVAEVDQTLLATVEDSPAGLRSALEPVLFGGKRLRAAMAWASAGKPDEGACQVLVELMVAIELLHVATLVHDDIIDGAEERRGQPAVHRLTGLEGGIIGGDWLIAQAFARSGPVSVQATVDLAETLGAMCHAQHAEAAAAFQASRSRDHVVEVAIGKTGRLFMAACRIGGLAGGIHEQEAEALAMFGASFGLGFQLLDDVEDFLQDFEDLRQGNYTLPVILLLEREQRAGDWLRAASSPSDFEEVVASAVASGAVRDSAASAAGVFAAARCELDDLSSCEGVVALQRLALHYQRRAENCAMNPP